MAYPHFWPKIQNALKTSLLQTAYGNKGDKFWKIAGQAGQDSGPD
jgi:hypothetical protein